MTGSPCQGWQFNSEENKYEFVAFRLDLLQAHRFTGLLLTLTYGGLCACD
jgi:hypothetical protein